MWIIPKTLQWSSGAPDTEAFISDLNGQSQACALSLMVRSKPSPARTWLQKWRRDSWTQHLSGRILKPSHAKSFATAWMSLWQVILVSPSAQQESDSEQKTQDTCGPTSHEQFELFAPECVSLKMLKDTSPSDSEKSLESWNKLVARRRGEYSLRVKSALRTRESGSSSWRSPIAQELGTGKHMDSADLKLGARVYNKNGKLMAIDLNRQVEIVARQHGQAAPASSSTDGSRQGLWATPRSGKTTDENPETWALRQAKGDVATMPLTAQVKAWATPKASDPQHSGPNMRDSAGNYALPAQVTKQWATPQLQDGHNINQDSTTHKTIPAQLTKMNAAGKLNPRWVETLMGLPVGWTMPSCASPVTIAPTNFDSSATESSQQQQRELFEF
jgi:hypothetical protein